MNSRTSRVCVRGCGSLPIFFSYMHVNNKQSLHAPLPHYNHREINLDDGTIIGSPTSVPPAFIWSLIALGLFTGLLAVTGLCAATGRSKRFCSLTLFLSLTGVHGMAHDEDRTPHRKTFKPTRLEKDVSVNDFLECSEIR